MSNKLQSVRGTHDHLPEDMYKFKNIITKAEYIDDNYDLVEFNLSDQEEHKIISKIQETLEENPYDTYEYWKEA